MRTFVSAHKAAIAHAGAHKSRVTNWTSYTDLLIRKGEIRPIRSDRTGRELCWAMVGPSDWWLVKTEIHRKPTGKVTKGPFATKRQALEAAGVTTSKKLHPGCYLLVEGMGNSLMAVTTEFAEGMGLTP